MSPYALLNPNGTVGVEKQCSREPAGVHPLNSLGCGLAWVANPAGVGRGCYAEMAVHAVYRRLADLLATRRAAR